MPWPQIANKDPQNPRGPKETTGPRPPSDERYAFKSSSMLYRGALKIAESNLPDQMGAVAFSAFFRLNRHAEELCKCMFSADCSGKARPGMYVCVNHHATDEMHLAYAAEVDARILKKLDIFLEQYKGQQQ